MLTRRRRRGANQLERLETRLLLAADVSSPQPADGAVDRAFTISAQEFLDRVSTPSFDPSVLAGATAVEFRPTVVGGSATGTPSDSPAKRVDPNVPAGAIYSGVGSVEITHSTGTFICTGALIHERFVLTAAHCFDLEENPDGQVDPGTTARFILNDGGNRTAELNVATITNHPDFSGFETTTNDDLAILTLATPAPSGTVVYPLSNLPMVVGERFDFVGYGQSGFGDVGFTVNPSFSVKRVGSNVPDVFLVDDEASGRDEVYVFDFDGPDTSGQFGGPTLGNDIEASVGGGDSGSPAFVTVDGELFIVGVNTFEFGIQNITNPPGFYAVNGTRGSLAGGMVIAPYVPWIQSILPNEVDIELTTVESADPVSTAGGASSLTYTITAKNKGPANATGVSIEEVLALPVGVTVESIVTSSGTFNGTTWSLGDLPGWSSATLTVSLTVDETAAAGTDVIGSVATLTSVSPNDTDALNDVSIVSTSIQQGVDIQVTVAESADPVVAGGTPLVYTVTAANLSATDASGVSISDLLTLPSGVSVQSVVASAGSYADSTWSLGARPGGATETLTMTLVASASAAGGVDVIAGMFTATLNEVDQVLSNNLATVTTSLAREADLNLIGVDTVDPVSAGSPAGGLVHTYLLSNSGPSDVDGAVLHFDLNLPVGVSRDFTLVSTGSLAGLTGDQAQWTVDVPAGGTAQLSILFSVAADAPSGVDLIQTAGTVVSAGGATLINVGDDAANVLTSITGGVSTTDVDVSIAESIDPVVAGSGPNNLTYVVTARNAGSLAATGVSLTESLTLPAGVSVASITPSSGTYLPANAPNGTWTVGDLAGGVSQTLTIVLTVGAAADAATSVFNAASLATLNETDANPANNVATAATVISRSVDLALSKTESTSEVIAGSGQGNLVHVLTASNLGVSNASGISIEEVIDVPSGVTVDSIVPSGATTFNGTTWTVGDLPSGAAATLTITYTVGANAQAGVDVIRSTAHVVAVNEPDVDTSNDSVTEATSVSVAVNATMDFGDALGYPTLIADNGPRHEIGSGLFLGATVDAEPDGIPTLTATGDDANGSDDEDGIDFVTPLNPGQTGVIVVTSSGLGRLDAWVDFNDDGDLTDPGEQVITSALVFGGLSVHVIPVPANATPSNTIARFRLSSAGGLAPTGFAADGEVEDYLVQIGTPPVGPPASPTDVLISGKQAQSWSVGSYSLTQVGHTAAPLPWAKLNTIEVPYAGTPTLTGAELVLKGTRPSLGEAAPEIDTNFLGFANGVATWSFDNLPVGLYQVAVAGLPAISFSVLPGDSLADPSNLVGFGDFAVFAAAFGATGPASSRSDFDGDGLVGFSDFAIFGGAFGKALPASELSPATYLVIDQVFGDLSFLSLHADDSDDTDGEWLLTF